ncbi:MAG: potassium channel protein [Acidobacteria bacterium]|nr:potassium channel protein [Acidobacteriota bacterium]
MERIYRRLVFIGIAIAVTMTVGTLGFTLIERFPLLDAFYMSLTTITTVGYGEIHPLSQAGRIFNSFLILFGVSVMFLAFGAMTQTAIELELNEVFGKRRVRRMIDKLDRHYIVCGYGRVGRGAAAELQRAGAPFVVLDRDQARVDRAMRDGMLAVAADATRDDMLKEAGIERARGLIAALTTDADNLFLVLSAKTLNPAVAVSARAGEEEAEKKLRRVGADVVFTPYNITGYRLAQALLRPQVSEFLDFTTQNIGLNVSIEQVAVAGGSEVAGRSLAQVQVRRDLGVIVLAIRRGDGRMHFNPPADAVIAGGDCLIVMGEPENLRHLERLLSEAHA